MSLMIVAMTPVAGVLLAYLARDTNVTLYQYLPALVVVVDGAYVLAAFRGYLRAVRFPALLALAVCVGGVVLIWHHQAPLQLMTF